MTLRVAVKANHLPGLPQRATRVVVDAVHALGFRAEGRAKARARRDTGAMANETANLPESGRPRTKIVAPKAYSGYQNYGTATVPPDYWFSGPVEEAGRNLGPAIAAALAGGLS